MNSMFVDESQYVDDKEKPEFMLNLSDEGLFMRLGLVSFQIEEYGFYDPNVILKMDWSDKGREVYKKYASIVKSRICKFYNSMKESGVLDTTEKVYFFILGFLMGVDVQRAIAGCVAALIAKQGLDTLCKEG
jgi:hypothetical protein